jgi:hypothetical protein
VGSQVILSSMHGVCVWGGGRERRDPSVMAFLIFFIYSWFMYAGMENGGNAANGE